MNSQMRRHHDLVLIKVVNDHFAHACRSVYQMVPACRNDSFLCAAGSQYLRFGVRMRFIRLRKPLDALHDKTGRHPLSGQDGCALLDMDVLIFVFICHGRSSTAAVRTHGPT